MEEEEIKMRVRGKLTLADRNETLLYFLTNKVTTVLEQNARSSMISVRLLAPILRERLCTSSGRTVSISIRKGMEEVSLLYLR